MRSGVARSALRLTRQRQSLVRGAASVSSGLETRETERRRNAFVELEYFRNHPDLAELEAKTDELASVPFAVMIEAEGGRPQPEGQFILVGKVAG